MQYVWDPAKDALNRRKHGLSLSDGVPALKDLSRYFWRDDRFDYGEERWITLGKNAPSILVVVSAEKEGLAKMKKKPSESYPSERRPESKTTGIISVEHNPGDPPIEDDTDWDRVNAITDEEIRAAVLDDPDQVPVPVFDIPGLTPVVNPKRLRDRLGLTQKAFAARYRIPIGTLRDWEQGRKFPDAPARAYLTVIDRDPEVVAGLLGKAAA